MNVNVLLTPWAVVLLSLTTCTTQSLDFADWAVPVSEEHRIVRYPLVEPF